MLGETTNVVLPFLAFLDHDDLWSSDKLERQMAAFERNPTLDLVFGHIQNFFTPEMPLEARERITVLLQLLQMNTEILPEAMVYRRTHANNYQRTHKHQRRTIFSQRKSCWTAVGLSAQTDPVRSLHRALRDHVFCDTVHG